jgi:hypothetical protein
VPFFLWINASPNDFRSDGSAAGAFVFVFYCAIGLMAFAIGIGVCIESIKILRRGGASAPVVVAQPKSPVANKTNQATENVAKLDSLALSKGQTFGALLIGTLFVVMGGRMIFGFDQWSCGRKGCDMTAWIYSWGGNTGVGFSYLLLGVAFFIPGFLSLIRKKK